jgi:hypothetical protein
MAKITKEKLIELIHESLEEYRHDSSYGMHGDAGADMGHAGGCAMADEPMEEPMGEPMDLESQVAELKGMVQQLMDMMGGQAMMELQAAAGEGRQSKDKEEKEEDE